MVLKIYSKVLNDVGFFKCHLMSDYCCWMIDMREIKVFRMEKSIGGEITSELAQPVCGSEGEVWSQDQGREAAERSQEQSLREQLGGQLQCSQ